jgi:copper oxidase (laccase) domain-containing protein
VDGRCTFDNPDTFYSYRAQKGVTGRMMGYIGIRTVG